MTVKLRQINTEDKKDVARFVDFPYQLYKDCDKWVPSLRSESINILNKQKHPFYEHSDADFYVVERDGQVLGRMAMLENRNYNKFRQTKTAFFGYFEVVREIEVARMLLSQAKKWTKTRGLTDIVGPRGVIGIDGSVLVDGFEHRPALAIPYNYPYYDEFIQDAGFEKLTDLLSGYVTGQHQMPERMHRLAEKVKKRRGFWIKRFESKAELKQWVPRIVEVHDEAFRQTASYYPPTQAEMKSVIDTILTIADPKLIKLVMKDQKIIGFIFAYYDIGVGLQKSNGRLFPFGWFHILRDQRRTKWLNVNGVGLLPEYQGLGGNTLLYTELQKTVNEAEQIEHIDVIQVDENNFKSVSDMENIGVQWYKRHRHYRLQI